MEVRSQQGTNNPNWKGGKLQKVCPTCGTEFETWPSYNAKYCSRKCHTKIGDKNPKWKGGFLINDGYKYIYSPDHPNATKAGYVLEHRLAMEEKIGRYLKRDEVVHHLNHDTLDNTIDNLHLCPSNTSHSSLHMTKRERDDRGRLLPTKMSKYRKSPRRDLS